MADVRIVLLVTLWIIWWPINKLLHVALFFLTPLWRLANFVLLPFIHIGHTIVTIITFPFSGRWLDRIETLYIYLGTAGLIGCLTGGILFILFKSVSSSLHLDKAVVRNQGRTTAEYRFARRKRKESLHHLPRPTPVVLNKVEERRGLLSQAIIEEEDSDF